MAIFTPTMIDMHAHLSDLGPTELTMRQEQGIYTLFSCGTPEEAAKLRSFYALYRSEAEDTSGPLRKACDIPFGLTCGVHPWNADKYTSEDFRHFYKCALAIGEIGMDRVWCDVPIDTQRYVFREQLLIAAYLEKPVVLHTKGCEAEILDIIDVFPGNILVHWYSGNRRILDEYIDMGCYFTVGPDRNPDIERIPVDRLFVETDGLDALNWLSRHGEGLVLEEGHSPCQEATLEDIPKYLLANMDYIAARKGVRREDLQRQMCANFKAFLTPPQSYIKTTETAAKRQPEPVEQRQTILPKERQPYRPSAIAKPQPAYY